MTRYFFGDIGSSPDDDGDTLRSKILEIIAGAYNEGFSEGMREHTSSKGGWPWNSQKQKYSDLLDNLPRPWRG